MSWFTSKAEKENRNLRAELLKAHIDLLDKRVNFDKLVRLATHLDSINDELEAENKRLKRYSGGLTKAQINSAIRLCHPDKHNNSKAANELTAALLELRT